MAKKFTEGALTFGVDLPLPFDLKGREAWGTGVTWPEGVHRAVIKGIALETNKKNGNKNAIVKMENVCGPDERTDLAGESRYQYFTLESEKGSEAANYFVGFLTQICPEALKEENLVKSKGKLFPELKYFVGATIEMTMESREVNGSPRVDLRKGSVKLVKAAPAAAKISGDNKNAAKSEDVEDAVDAFMNPAD